MQINNHIFNRPSPKFNMFFAVHIISARKKAVVPSHWIKDVETQLPKYINNSINRAQVVMVYYSQPAIDAMRRGEPAIHFQPNFRFSPLNAEFPNMGCYIAKLCKSFCTFNYLNSF